jgi:hypothetical protein
MNEPYLTIAEINAKYPNQWVLLANPTLTRLHEVRGGHVLFHTADRSRRGTPARATPLNSSASNRGRRNHADRISAQRTGHLRSGAGGRSARAVHVQLHTRHRFGTHGSSRAGVAPPRGRSGAPGGARAVALGDRARAGVSLGAVSALGRVRTQFVVAAHDFPIGVAADGLLGLDFLRGFVLKLDFARGRAALKPPRKWWQFWK